MNYKVTTPLRPSDLKYNLKDGTIVDLEALSTNARYTELLITLDSGERFVILGDFTVEFVEPGYDDE